MESNIRRTSPRPVISIVAAMSKNGIIGLNGTMPWHIPDDLRRFRRLTLGRPLIMGRKTFESIGAVLPNRETIVLTSNDDFEEKTTVHKADSLQKAFEMAVGLAQKLETDEVIIAGGARIFEAFLTCADFLKLTLIDADIVGDTYFPPIDWDLWQPIAQETFLPIVPSSFGYAFSDFQRKSAFRITPAP